jgi:serine/threonine protein phosphatase 1
LKGFVKRWFSGEEPESPKPSTPAGQRIYCIGDVHGRLDLLLELESAVQEDAAGYQGECTVVYLGDYIDRGDESKQVIDHLLDAPIEGFKPVYLLGNHEQTLLDFLRHPRAVAAWLTYGGRAALNSYGIAVTREPSSQDLLDLRDELEHRLPSSHLHFYRDLALMHVAGDYCFVHAGIRPGVPLQEQRNEDLLWIREDFTESTVRHQHVVVHGHSITPDVDWRDNRIGIDTGAFQSGVLTCLVLEGSERRVLQTGKAT